MTIINIKNYKTDSSNARDDRGTNLSHSVADCQKESDTVAVFSRRYRSSAVEKAILRAQKRSW